MNEARMDEAHADEAYVDEAQKDRVHTDDAHIVGACRDMGGAHMDGPHGTWTKRTRMMRTWTQRFLTRVEARSILASGEAQKGKNR